MIYCLNIVNICLAPRKKHNISKFKKFFAKLLHINKPEIFNYI